jgi:hypothetical protein
MIQMVVELLSTKHKNLSSNYSTSKKKKKKEEGAVSTHAIPTIWEAETGRTAV